VLGRALLFENLLLALLGSAINDVHVSLNILFERLCDFDKVTTGKTEA